MIDTSKLPKQAPDYDLRDLLEAGCHFGHDASAWNPNMAEWIFSKQDGIHVFDLEKTAQQLQLAYNYLYQLGKEGKSVIFVGTKRQAREAIQEQATAAGAHWIISRWMGGLLTNWSQVSKSIKKMIKIEKGLESGEFDKYTKYEQIQMEKDAGRSARFFDGLRNLKDLPDVVFVVDPGKEDIVIKECLMTGVPVVALVDSDTNPDGVDLVIPANDDGRGSIELIVTELAKAYAAGRGKKIEPNKKEKEEVSKETKKVAKKTTKKE